jgi:hypothetical protein
MRILKTTALAATLIFTFAIAAAAQDNEPMAGGYSKVSTRSVAAKKAAAAAITQHSISHPKDKMTLVKIIKAEQQVVAGMNYRLCMTVLDRRGVRRSITAVVYQPIRKKLRLTDWSTGACRNI